jgi:hypothetical protein
MPKEAGLKEWFEQLKALKREELEATRITRLSKKKRIRKKQAKKLAEFSYTGVTMSDHEEAGETMTRGIIDGMESVPK